MSFFDFNTADQQQSFDLIPKGTLARVDGVGALDDVLARILAAIKR